jgi:YbbR domain-containing protein
VSEASSTLGSRLRRAALDNFLLKLTSLIFAIGFYAFIHSAQNAQRTVQVAIIADMPSESTPMQLVSELPETVSVTVMGSRTELDSLQGKQLDPIPLNLRSAKTVEDLRITPSMITGLPLGVRVTRIIPSSLDIRWEKKIQRSLNVQVAITGKLPKDMEMVGEIQIRPRALMASGPESAVNVLQRARADAFDVSALRREGKHTRRIALDKPPSNVLYSINSVEATVVLARKRSTKEFVTTVDVIGLVRAKVRPKTVRISVQGPPEKIKTLREADVVPTVDPKEAGADTSQAGSKMVAVKVPEREGLRLSVTPKRVLVKW